MIRILRSLAVGLSLFMLAGAALAEPPTYKLGVDGLACPFCAYGIEKQLSKLEDVERIDVDIEKGAVFAEGDGRGAGGNGVAHENPVGLHQF